MTRKINRSLGLDLAQKVGAEPKECYKNSVLAAFATSGREMYVTYVEGLVKLAQWGIFISHGWLEIDGEIVDVTLEDIEPEHYHDVFRFDKDQIHSLVRKRKTLPFYFHEKDGHRTFALTEWGLYQEIAKEHEREQAS